MVKLLYQTCAHSRSCDHSCSLVRHVLEVHSLVWHVLEVRSLVWHLLEVHML